MLRHAQATPLFGALMQKALDLVRGCDCVSDSGCPACVQNADCGEYNAVLSKRAAVVVLNATLQAEAEHRSRMALQVCISVLHPTSGFICSGSIKYDGVTAWQCCVLSSRLILQYARVCAFRLCRC